MQPLALRLLAKPQKKRCAVATVCNRLAATFMASSFLTMAKLLSYAGVVSLSSSRSTNAGWLWLVAGTDALLETAQLVALAALTGLCALFMYKYLPETKGRSLEEMLGYFQQIANTQGGPDATQASAQSNRPTCLRFQRARVLAAADLCACATQACWTARRRSLALGSSSRTRRPSHRKSPWRRRPEHNSTTCTSWTLCTKAGEGLAPARANRDGGQDGAAARAWLLGTVG